jgi:pyruvate formate lyase activating enzyme
MWIRYVLVPGVTDDAHEIAQLADYLKSLQAIQRIEVLPFHKLGEHKWQELGLTYRLTETPAATHEQAEAARTLFRQRGFDCC